MGHIVNYSFFFTAFGICPTHFIRTSHIILEWRRRRQMTAKEAVAARIMEFCHERDLSVNSLANISGVPPSTIYSMLNMKSMNPGVVSIKQICDGLDVSLRFFFDTPLFEELEQEIK